jgi:hypothetical protein
MFSTIGLEMAQKFLKAYAEVGDANEQFTKLIFNLV